MYLKGRTVLDFSQYIPGPYAALRLADFGATVIKVEPPNGELARAKMGPPDEQGIVFEANNASKQSITVNLKSEGGLERAFELIKSADVLIESFRPGVMKRLGLDYESVSKANEKIIYCSISGYGLVGKEATLGSHDINYLSLTGVLSQLKDHKGRPIHPSLTLADHLGGMAASESILAALFARGQTGRGTYIDVSLVDALLGLMNNHFVLAHKTGKQNGITALAGTIVSYAIYETSDHRYVSLGALEKKFWENFCNACEKPEWIKTQYSYANLENPTFMELTNLFKSKTLAEWSEFAEEVDCCLAPVLEATEAMNRYGSGVRQMIVKDKESVQVATRYEQDFVVRRTSAPALGEHSEKIIQGLAKKKSL
ncbi:CaiB/BaiF CoA transferase family protein [Fredinandcohnia sp. 179-A 10B2 NHS]|uniref:CaiB/BaiF CoA transferase family protein n=1 Tax=Fredinandcohnia sp. 179-A 10B2 NHS TaxID=3235176 RepID=UPI00399FD0DD